MHVMVDLGNHSRGKEQRVMMLRVWAGNDFCETRLRQDLCIGSGETDDVHIRGPDVAEMHAGIFEQEGQLMVKAREGQVLWLPDGKQTQILILTPGVCFGIGDAVLQCWQDGVEEVAGQVKVVKEIAPVEPGPVAEARCVRCSADLSRVPARAKYCPRCGQLRDGEPNHPHSGMIDGTDPMDEEMPPPPFDPNQPVRSQMIYGYATAMHNLGVRYEEGRRGTPRNLREAVRCYIKSARLGNDRALDRLTGR